MAGSPAGYSYQIDYVRFWLPQAASGQPVIAGLNPGGTPSAGQVTVSFGPVSGATSYRVTAFPQDEFAYTGNWSGVDTNVMTATRSSSPISVTGLTNGKPYCFTVAAINSTGYSIESLPVPVLGPSPQPADTS